MTLRHRLPALTLIVTLLAIPAASASNPLHEEVAHFGVVVDVFIDVESLKECVGPFFMEDAGNRPNPSVDSPYVLMSQDKKFGVVVYGATITSDNGYHGIRIAC